MGLSAQMKMDFMLGKALEMCRCLPTGFTDNSTQQRERGVFMTEQE